LRALPNDLRPRVHPRENQVPDVLRAVEVVIVDLRNQRSLGEARGAGERLTKGDLGVDGEEVRDPLPESLRPALAAQYTPAMGDHDDLEPRVGLSRQLLEDSPGILRPPGHQDRRDLGKDRVPEPTTASEDKGASVSAHRNSALHNGSDPARDAVGLRGRGREKLPEFRVEPREPLDSLAARV